MKLLSDLRILPAAGLALGLFLPSPGAAAADPAMQKFNAEIAPLLDKYCYDCHGNGNHKGGVRLDEFAHDSDLRNPQLWNRVLKNTRAHLMPPADEDHLPDAELARLSTWIKREAFQIDPARPDPGRVTVRRLNRAEYRNTIRDLLGVDFDTQKEFPADDTGHGFDNIADVLTISPMLMEKYLDAAQNVVAQAVPTHSRVVAEQTIPGRQFAAVPVLAESAVKAVMVSKNLVAENTAEKTGAADKVTVVPAVAPATPAPAADAPKFLRPPPAMEGSALDLSYYTPVSVSATHRVEHAGKYQLVVSVRALEHYVDEQFDLNRCHFLVKCDGETLFDKEFVREGDQSYEFTFDREWKEGDHQITVEMVPVAPDRPQPRLLRLRLNGITVRGPLEPGYWVLPAGYAHFFPKEVPHHANARRQYARELLADFTARAFRRPADPETVDRLVALAEATYSHPDATFESGIAQAMVAVLASPRFIFREEEVEKPRPGQAFPNVDEYALASRLSYFFWSSMPDDELFRLAAKHQLRAQLPAQITRMLADKRAKEFVRNFTGQWLQARDITNVPINTVDVFLRDHPMPGIAEARNVFMRIVKVPEDKRTPQETAEFAQARKTFREFFRLPKPDLTDDLRRAMQQETQLVFEHILKEDRSLLELLESDYTYLNEDLAKHYGIDGVKGPEMRLVQLAPDSPRGGILTQGTVLAVTSNPTRTSPVKRGVFILDAILGTPPPPPPPNIPSLEDAASPEELAKMSLRDNLALHRKNEMCASCHERMDPLGLALENFNAMGKWRTTEYDKPIDPHGQLITGESFKDIRELKHILATNHRLDFYRCFTEKLLTYALGRGLDYHDTETVDELVAQLDASGGKPSVLLRGIVNAAAFQQRRPLAPVVTADNTPGAAPDRSTNAQP